MKDSKKTLIFFLVIIFTSFSLISCSTNNAITEHSNNVIDFLKQYKNEESLSLLEETNNPYRVVCVNSDNTKSLYIFSTPVWKKDFSGFIDSTINNYKSVGYSVSTSYPAQGDNCFHINGNSEEYKVKIILPEKMKLNCNGTVMLPALYGLNVHALEYKVLEKEDQQIYAYNNTNGFNLVFKGFSVRDVKSLFFNLEISETGSIINKPTYAALMENEQKPNFIIKTFAIANNDISEVSPILDCNEFGYKLSFESQEKNCKYDKFVISFEKYIGSSIYDTTVHSKYKDENMVFSNHACIGMSDYWGEEWCYYRVAESQLINFERTNKDIIKSQINFFNLSENILEINKQRMNERWCSFNTTWENKKNGIDCGNNISNNSNSNFISFNFSDESTYISNEKPVEDYGALMKPNKINESDYLIIATADNYNNPPFIELVY